MNSLSLNESCEVVLEPVVDTKTGYLFWDPAPSDLVNGTRSNACLSALANQVTDELSKYIVTPTKENVCGLSVHSQPRCIAADRVLLPSL